MNATTRQRFGQSSPGNPAPIAIAPVVIAPVVIAPVVIAIVVAAPLIAVLASLALPFGETIRHVAATVGASYAFGTIALCILVGAFATIIGVAAAFVAALCDFPGRRVLSLALALPLAVPAYIAAYAYADALGPFGAMSALAHAMRAFGVGDIRSLSGAAFILTITLYPYAYLATRAALVARSGAMIEAARTLGAAPLRAVLRLILPATRPAIAGAAALIMMETAADFGVADYFGVPTLSVGIFRTWRSFGDLTAASQLASALFLVALALIAFEALGRRGRAADAARTSARAATFRLSGPARIAAPLMLALPVFLGFALPVALIAAKVDPSFFASASRGLIPALSNSLTISLAGASLTIAAALLLAMATRGAPRAVSGALVRVATLGYAVPGAVIAIGVLSVAGWFSAAGIVFAAGPALLLYAYLVRFLTAGYNGLAGGLAQIDRSVDDAAKTLGAGPVKAFVRVHAPLLLPSIIAAAVIVGVDIIKELPATIILRDFNFETLATRVYRLAGDERLHEAAPDALILIAAGAVPVIALSLLARRVQKCVRFCAKTPR